MYAGTEVVMSLCCTGLDTEYAAIPAMSKVHLKAYLMEIVSNPGGLKWSHYMMGAFL